MEKKLKKQRKNIIIKITAVLFAVWLIVSVVFSVITIYTEKNTQLTNASTDFHNMINRASAGNGLSYNLVCQTIDFTKTHGDRRAMGELTTKITCGADGYYDNNQQIIMFIHDYGESGFEDPPILMDTDKEIYAGINTKVNDVYNQYFGTLVYDDFINSITEEQLNNIIEHLNIKTDKYGKYYAVQLQQAYYNPENGQIIPKTIDLVKTSDDITWSAQNEVIETYELNPHDTQGLVLHTLSGDTVSIIDGQFITGEFKSEGLITDLLHPYNYLYEEYSPDSDIELSMFDSGVVGKVNPFSYLYMNSETVSISTFGYEGSKLQNEYLENETKFYMNLEQEIIYDDAKYEQAFQNFLDSAPYLDQSIGIKYVKRINVLDFCKNTLIIGISALFLFFLIIGIILAVMMCKVMKTQMTEEQKRVEVTNALAHDIKTPLFIISGYAQNLKENVNTDKREHYCDRIIERTDEVNELVHKMLDFSNPEVSVQSLDFSSFMLKDITNEVLNNFDELKNSRNIILSTNDTHEIYADKDQIERVIRNLLDNALRYSDEDTDITIDINEKSFSISNVCSNISSEDIKHLIEPYYRVEKNRNTKGNGLGLSIVKSILDVHGYKLDIKLQDNLITFMIEF